MGRCGANARFQVCQSDIGNCFAEIIALLKDERYVLFSGTSCQVKGLQSALESKHINTEKLLTIDFFCHGVPSPLIWSDYLHYTQQKLRFKAENYRFRNKKYGWGKGTQSRGTGYLSTWRPSCRSPPFRQDQGNLR